jgi:alginate O-acetyltransferase complex protein AlgI
MLFSSPIFLFQFLPVVIVLYLISPRPLRNLLLLVASLFFYAWGEVDLVVVMLLSTAMNYGFGIWVNRCREKPHGVWVVSTAVAANLLILVYFKYFGFLIENLNPVLQHSGIEPVTWSQVPMPIGISFYTFQALSYVVDVYRGQVQPDRNPIRVALYIALFPQLVAGPIIRYTDIAEQIRDRHISVSGVAAGLQRFVLGLGKKMLIANSVGSVADAIFEIPNAELSTAVCWLGIVCYTLQIYFDFSGYSDMAIGLGQLFGFRFRENFNYPYISQSITDFWRRWHISLSSWYRDYLYIPLGGSHCAAWKVYRNLLVVFLLCGLWHGASWNFVIWGLFHGGFLILERSFLSRSLSELWRPVRHAYTLLVVMCGWVLFRAMDLPHALSYLKAMFSMTATSPESGVIAYVDSGVITVLVVGILGSLPLLPVVIHWREKMANRERAAVWNVGCDFVRVAGVAVVLLASAAVMAGATHNPFIYFRF